MAPFPDFPTRGRRVLVVSLAGGVITLMVLLTLNSLHGHGSPGEMAGIVAAAILAGLLGGLLLVKLWPRLFSESGSLAHAVSLPSATNGPDPLEKSSSVVV